MKIVKFLNSVVINKNGGFGGGQPDHLKGFRFQRKPFAKAGSPAGILLLPKAPV